MGITRFTESEHPTMAAFNQRYDEIEETFSNPNLLINGDFQIWQMGTSFTQSGYTADRWRSHGGLTISNIANGIQISNATSEYILFSQTLEMKEYYKSKTMTLSCNILSLEGTANAYVYTGVNVGYKSLKSGDNKWNLTIPADAAQLRVVFKINAETIIQIKWVKLELGNVETPFIPRPYAEELALCQRFTLKNEPNTGMYGGVTGSYIFVTLNTPTSMRAIPGIKLGESTTFSARGINGVSALDKESLIVYGLVSTSVVLRFSNPNTTNFPNGTPVTAFSSGDAWYLSAEL